MVWGAIKAELEADTFRLRLETGAVFRPASQRMLSPGRAALGRHVREITFGAAGEAVVWPAVRLTDAICGWITLAELTRTLSAGLFGPPEVPTYRMKSS